MPNFAALKSATSNALPENGRQISVRFIQVFTLTLVLSLLVLIPLAENRIAGITHDLIVKIENRFHGANEKFSYLLTNENTSRNCQDSLTDLRQSVFNSDYVKEIGLFDPQGKIYCTSNNGDSSFQLYQTIIGRLENDPQHTTLSYTKTKLSKQRSVAYLFAAESGYGLSILIPPRYFIHGLERYLEGEHVNFEIRVISRKLGDSVFKEGITTHTVKSQLYPLEVSVSTTPMYYVNQIWRYMWLIVLIAGLTSLYLLYRQQKSQNTNSLENSLRFAITNNYLDLHFQPIVDLTSGKTVGCESLLRWNDPVQGFISPGIFIPLAEKVDLIEDITRLVVNKVYEFIDQEPLLFKDIYISVNISRSVILKPSFVEYIFDLVQHKPSIAQGVVFEITEDNNFSQDELGVLKTNLMQLSSYGFKFAVDDFGTGYSGLNFIRQFPFDYVKIDRVFVKNLSGDSNIIPLLESMKTIVTQLNMVTIMEGVEEQSQLDILKRLGFTYIQGYYYSKPLPKEEIVEYLS